MQAFPTSSRIPKGETLETFFYKAERKQGVPLSLVKPTSCAKLRLVQQYKKQVIEITMGPEQIKNITMCSSSVVV